MKMKSPLLKLGWMGILVLSLMLNGCNKNDDGGPSGDGDTVKNEGSTDGHMPDILALAQAESTLTSLIAALTAAEADLVQTLSGEGPFTVFAPSNEAFSTFFRELEGYASLNDFDEASEKALLAEILKYHVIGDAAVFAADLSDGDLLATFQGANLEVTIENDVLLTDATGVATELIGADNAASNGVVHIVDKVLVPQDILDVLFPKPNLPELIADSEALSLFLEAIEKTGLNDELAAEGPLTVFAPSNEAIEELFDFLGVGFATFDDFDNSLELRVLRDLLKYHLIEGRVLSSDLEPGNVPTLLDGETLQISTTGGAFTIVDSTGENANLTSVDNEASNGVVHIIDKVLIPQFVLDFIGDRTGQSESNTISDLVSGSEDFSLLKQALVITGLLDTLEEEGPFTVFAPSKEAFEQLLFFAGASQFESLDAFDTETEIELLRTVLAYHVSPEVLPSSAFMEGELETLSGTNQLQLLRSNGRFVLKDVTGLDAGFEISDIPASNGVIHVVDRVLLPAGALELAVDTSTQALMDLLGALDREDAYALLCMMGSRFEGVLEDEFTFFLPTNTAFIELFDTLDGIQSLADFDAREELEVLATILSYHFVPNTALLAAALSDAPTLHTFQGESLEVRIEGDRIFLMDPSGVPSEVTSADLDVLQGVIHLIDKVLVPEAILSQL